MAVMLHNRAATALMFVAVAGSSLMPVLIALGGGKSPFLFNTALIVGNGVGSVVLLFVAYRPLVFSRDVWRTICRRVPSVPMLFWVIGYLDLAFYAWSTQYVDVTVSVVLFETWPILLILLTGWLFRHERRYSVLSPWTLALVVIAFLGVIPVIVSRIGGLGGIEGSSLPTLGIGVGLALVAAGLTSLSAFGFRWAADVGAELYDTVGTHRQPSLELFGVVVGMVVCSLVTLPLSLLVGLGLNESMTSETLVFGGIAGVLSAVFGGFVWRKATLMTDDLSIHALVYLDPVLGLGWLFAFSLVGGVSVGYVLAGAFAIVTANVGIYFSGALRTRSAIESEGSGRMNGTGE